MVGLVEVCRPLSSILHSVEDHSQHCRKFVVLSFADARFGAKWTDIIRRKFFPSEARCVEPLPALQSPIERIVVSVGWPCGAFVVSSKLGLRVEPVTHVYKHDSVKLERSALIHRVAGSEGAAVIRGIAMELHWSTNLGFAGAHVY